MDHHASHNTPRVVANRLRVIAVDQLQVVDLESLKEFGVHRNAALRRVDSGEWTRMARGVYRVASSGIVASIDQRMMAAVLAVPGSVIIGWFAAHIHGLPVLFDVKRLPVTLALPVNRRSTVVDVRRSSGPLPSRPWQTGRVATPVLTLVTLAASGASSAQLETVLDAALTRRLVTVKAIEALLDKPGWLRFRGRPKLVALLAARAGGRALFRSRTEAKVQRWIQSSSLPCPVSNLLVPTPYGAIEVDKAWQSPKVALEISPFWHHGSRVTQERDVDRRQALVTAGWRTVEADDRHLVDRRAFEPIIELLTGLLHG
jgi:hypothetical protein